MNPSGTDSEWGRRLLEERPADIFQLKYGRMINLQERFDYTDEDKVSKPRGFDPFGPRGARLSMQKYSHAGVGATVQNHEYEPFCSGKN